MTVTRDQLGAAVAIVSLCGLLWQAGARIGTLTERLETLRTELGLVRADLRAINQHLITWVQAHQQQERQQ